jgi:8-oxo-dGTP pyrophosphatase MutT (NUDIX family)
VGISEAAEVFPGRHRDADGLFDQPADVEVVGRGVSFLGRVWDVVHETFEYNEHHITRDFVQHTGAVAVLALDETDRLLAIRQYRHPVRLREWEIPAGLLDLENENPLEAAKRELAEEVDLEAATWNVLADYCTSPGGSDEIIRIYLARNLQATSVPFGRTEEEADLELRWVTLDDAVEAVSSNAVTNSIFQIAILRAHVARERGWDGLPVGESPWPLLQWRNATRAR